MQGTTPWAWNELSHGSITTKPRGRNYYPHFTGAQRSEAPWPVTYSADIQAPVWVILKPIFSLLYHLDLLLLYAQFFYLGYKIKNLKHHEFSRKMCYYKCIFLGEKQKLVSQKYHVFVPDVRWKWFQTSKWNNFWKSERDHSTTLRGKARTLSVLAGNCNLPKEISFLKSKTLELVSSMVMV